MYRYKLAYRKNQNGESFDHRENRPPSPIQFVMQEINSADHFIPESINSHSISHKKNQLPVLLPYSIISSANRLVPGRIDSPESPIPIQEVKEGIDSASHWSEEESTARSICLDNFGSISNENAFAVSTRIVECYSPTID